MTEALAVHALYIVLAATAVVVAVLVGAVVWVSNTKQTLTRLRQKHDHFVTIVSAFVESQHGDRDYIFSGSKYDAVVEALRVARR